MIKRVGEFSIDTDTSTISGPAEYMRERGNDRIDRIAAGLDTVFNFALREHRDQDMAVLVSIQTDYAGWKGMRQIRAIGSRR